MMVTSQGIYMVTLAKGDVDLGGIKVKSPKSTNYYTVLSLLDTTGKVKWAKPMGASAGSGGTLMPGRLTPGPGGEPVLLGALYGSVTLGTKTLSVSSKSSNDILLLGLNKSAGYKWHKAIPTVVSGISSGHGLYLDSAGCVVHAGTFGVWNTIGTITLMGKVHSSNGWFDIFMHRYCP